MAGSIRIYYQNEEKTAPNGCTLEDYLATHNINENTAVATAVNGVFIAREERENYFLEPGDKITLFSPITGG